MPTLELLPPVYVPEICRWQESRLAEPGWPTEAKSVPQSPLWGAIYENHYFNSRLWLEEDLARRSQAPDSEIAANKRAIDQFNQKRNDAIERMDALLLDYFKNVELAPTARLNSETAGSMVDRLSILSLKVYFTAKQLERPDASSEHKALCATRLEQLRLQRADLAGCLAQLLAEFGRGMAYYKTYRQFKMYNDPRFNPHIKH